MERGPIPPPAPEPANEEELDERMRTVPFGELPVVLAAHLAPRTSSQSLDWIADLARLSERYGIDVPGIRRAATDLAWLARQAQQRYPGDLEWGAARSVAGSRIERLVLAYVHGQRLRFDYMFESLRARCDQWLREFHEDALILSLAALAGLGGRAANGLDLYRRAVESANADDKSRHVCLTAMWFADYVDGQAGMLLSLSDEMMARGEGNENVHYRRAAALRKLRRYEEALSEIDRAIELFGVGNLVVHEHYTQERQAILAAREMDQRAELLTRELGEQIMSRVNEQVEQASVQLDQRLREAGKVLSTRVNIAEDMVSKGLLQMVEVLGVFVALLAFLVGSGAVVVKADTIAERTISMGVVLVGAIGFFLLLRLIVGFRRRQPPPL